MRWEFAAPEVQTIVSDGEMLYSYDPDLNQVVEAPLKQALKSSRRDFVPARDGKYQPRLQGRVSEFSGV